MYRQLSSSAQVVSQHTNSLAACGKDLQCHCFTSRETLVSAQCPCRSKPHPDVELMLIPAGGSMPSNSFGPVSWHRQRLLWMTWRNGLSKPATNV